MVPTRVVVVLFLVGIVGCAASARGGSAGATVRPWASGSVDQPPVREGLQSWASQLVFAISPEVVNCSSCPSSSEPTTSPAAPPWLGQRSLAASFPCDITAADKWCAYSIPLRAATTLGRGNGQVAFSYAIKQQSFIIANVSLVSCASAGVTDPSTLAAAFYYPERDDPTAAWRTEAQARINTTRTTRLSIPVVDINGRPVKGALVNVYQQRHRFGFGSALRASLLSSNPTYADKVKEHFDGAGE
ncbi:uncharacterized protein ACA1_140960 [Acanthamoeba castellanii str. Neff]|uniref:Uncharacterized protein n=1 Tax=Acanthamoeba castellanii (strain ATCC 30010 / Neff) TaxID=1257118 RepID=L8GGH9_ACACF|nr:uncharacterized protein ACA1_140960 [Acanthamoeba castellanii str. Neff]ELR12170.1 hypothetical protein ACA1_140960 [Acanthamoeba castellanii str. Neff]